MNGEFEIPVPQPSDSEDVSTALETAEILWSSGNHGEAMRLLGLAAEKASDAGDDLRAVQLARLAAEFRDSARPPPNEDPAEPPAEPVVASASPPSDLVASETVVSISHTVWVDEENSPAAMHSTEASPLTAPEPTEHAAPTMPDVTREPEAEDYSAREDLAAESDEDDALQSSTPTPVPSRPTARTPRSRKALRVAVLPGADHEGFLEVRVLADHEIPPVGAHEALLVALDADIDLLER